MEVDIGATTIENTKQHESALVGMILNNPDRVEDCDDITKEDFLDIECGIIFEEMKRLYEFGDPLDIVSLSKRLGGIGHKLAEIMSGTPAIGFDYYVKTVKTKSTLRKLHDIAINMAAMSLSDSQPETVMEIVTNKFSTIVGEVQKDTFNSKGVTKEVLDHIYKMYSNPVSVTGMTTGFDNLDNKLYGIHNSDLIILAARPAKGKSAFALQLCRNIALYNKANVLFYSLEMGREQLMQRLISAESKVKLDKLRTGNLTELELHAIEESAITISNMGIFINDKSGIKLKDIRRELKSMKAKGTPIHFLVIDYLQLMGIGTGRENMVQVVTEISRGLKTIAKDFNIPVLALSQLSRNVEHRGGKPKLADLRDSGSIEQDADIVMLLHSEKQEESLYGEKDIELLIEKHRNGATGSLYFNFSGAKMTFMESTNKEVW